MSSGQYGTLNLNGGLTTNAYTTLAFNLNLSVLDRQRPNSEPIYAGDLINLGGFGVERLGRHQHRQPRSDPTALGDYRLFGGNLGTSL